MKMPPLPTSLKSGKSARIVPGKAFTLGAGTAVPVTKGVVGGFFTLKRPVRRSVVGCDCRNRPADSPPQVGVLSNGAVEPARCLCARFRQCVHWLRLARSRHSTRPSPPVFEPGSVLIICWRIPRCSTSILAKPSPLSPRSGLCHWPTNNDGWNPYSAPGSSLASMQNLKWSDGTTNGVNDCFQRPARLGQFHRRRHV